MTNTKNRKKSFLFFSIAGFILLLAIIAIFSIQSGTNNIKSTETIQNNSVQQEEVEIIEPVANEKSKESAPEPNLEENNKKKSKK